MICGIGWDDDPTDYMQQLKGFLRAQSIDLTIVKNRDHLRSQWTNTKYAFIVVDNYDENDGKRYGIDLARESIIVDSNRPVFIVTLEPERINTGQARLPGSVIVKPKQLSPALLALEIRRELGRRGDFVDSSKVFVIYGHDENADGTFENICHWLDGMGIKPEVLRPGNVEEEINRGLLSRMSDSAAFIAICTPDDEGKDGAFRPRQNVLLEMGLAMGLSNGLRRLIIVQKWGPKPSQRAVLPSDVSGHLPLRFVSTVDKIYGELEENLRLLGVEMRRK